MPGERSYPEFGQCVHKVARHPANPDRLYLQNHGGVYRSDDGGDTWQDIAAGAPDGVRVRHGGAPARAGHGLHLPHHRRRRALARRRQGPGLALPRRGRDLGAAGRRRPTGDYFVAVMRDAMCADTHDSAGLYFGGRNGAVWASADAGGSWKEIVRDLPDVMMVRAAVV